MSDVYDVELEMIGGEYTVYHKVQCFSEARATEIGYQWLAGVVGDADIRTYEVWRKGKFIASGASTPRTGQEVTDPAVASHWSALPKNLS